MCVLCHDTGIIRKETYPGVIETNGCNCEVAIRQQVENDKRWQVWLIKFESMKQDLERSHQQKVS
ncbi:phage protein [Bacillus anthracis]|nr:phage protein [Bacillus anthracis]KOS30740.1 phage protein [Bacillus anthracis]